MSNKTKKRAAKPKYKGLTIRIDDADETEGPIYQEIYGPFRPITSRRLSLALIVSMLSSEAAEAELRHNLDTMIRREREQSREARRIFGKLWVELGLTTPTSNS